MGKPIESKFLDTKLEKSKNPTTDVEITAKNCIKPEPQNRSVQPAAVGKGIFFFSNFFNFLVELCYSKTFGEKNFCPKKSWK